MIPYGTCKRLQGWSIRWKVALHWLQDILLFNKWIVSTFACMPISKVFQSIKMVKTHGKMTINKIHDLHMYRYSNKNWNQTNKISPIKMKHNSIWNEESCRFENQWKSYDMHWLIQVEDGFESLTKCITKKRWKTTRQSKQMMNMTEIEAWIERLPQTAMEMAWNGFRYHIMKLHGWIWWLIEASLQQNGWSTEGWRCSSSRSGLVNVPKRLGQLREEG